MLGKILKYDNINEMGYIVGYDEKIYFFHQCNVKENEELKRGDIVDFEYIFNNNELSYAINIEKKKNSENNKKARVYKEVYEILKHLPDGERAKISESFLKEIKDNMDRNYKYKVVSFENFENQKMLDETRTLLAIVYRDYLATDEEKANIIKKEKQELYEEEVKKEKLYSSEIFNRNKENTKKEEKHEGEQKQEVALTVIEEKKWFKRFVNFIKRIFKH